VQAFVPALLPVAHPPIVIEGALVTRLASAEAAVRHLELAAQMVPSVDWFLYGFVRKEAVLTSQIEGTQATLTDLLQFEAKEDETPTPDVQEVCNYVEALTYAHQPAAAKGTAAVHAPAK
jgi:Fic family protein